MIVVGEIRDRPTAEVAVPGVADRPPRPDAPSTPAAPRGRSAGSPTWGSSPTCSGAACSPSSRSGWCGPSATAARRGRRPAAGSGCRSIGPGSPSAARRAAASGYLGRMVLAELLEPGAARPRPGDPGPGRRPGPRGARPSGRAWSAAGSAPARRSTRAGRRPPRSAASSASPTCRSNVRRMRPAPNPVEAKNDHRPPVTTLRRHSPDPPRHPTSRSV